MAGVKKTPVRGGAKAGSKATKAMNEARAKAERALAAIEARKTAAVDPKVDMEALVKDWSDDYNRRIKQVASAREAWAKDQTCATCKEQAPHMRQCKSCSCIVCHYCLNNTVHREVTAKFSDTDGRRGCGDALAVTIKVKCPQCNKKDTVETLVTPEGGRCPHHGNDSKLERRKDEAAWGVPPEPMFWRKFKAMVARDAEM